MEQRFDYKNNDFDRITYFHTRVPQCEERHPIHLYRGKIVPNNCYTALRATAEGSTMASQGPTARTATVRKVVLPMPAFGLVSIWMCISGKLSAEISLHNLWSSAPPTLKSGIYHSKEKINTSDFKIHTHGAMVAQTVLLFQDIKYTPLFPSVLLLPCCQYESIAGTDSHCIFSCFLLDPPQCGCSGPSVSVELLSSRPLRTFF